MGVAEGMMMVWEPGGGGWSAHGKQECSQDLTADSS